MNVLSLFDGMSCGHIALERLGVKVDAYYASEIDKFAIKVSSTKFLDTIHLGSVENWRKWDIDWSSIDLILAGSPCQGFSFAGKQLAFDDPRSKLFFEFVDILNHINRFNPKVKYLLENVKMTKPNQLVINNFLGIRPLEINSALVSAQNRERLYWTNISNKTSGLFSEPYIDIPQPTDKGLLLKDVLESNISDKYYLSDKMVNFFINHTEKHQLKGNSGIKFKPTNGDKKANCLVVKNGQYTTDNYIKDYIPCDYRRDEGVRFKEDGKSGTLLARARNDESCGQLVAIREDINYRIRRLTPIECCRLQTVDDDYFMHDGKQIVSDTQVYKMLGNGWTVDVISHILSYM